MRLEILKNSINVILEEEVLAGRMKGNSALLFNHGKEIYYNNYGFANEEKEILMDRSTIIRLFSMTKPITACAAMIAQERGYIDFDDPVSKYLPEYTDMNIIDNDGNIRKATKPITIKNLLFMTSGIPYGECWEGCSMAGRKMQTLFDELTNDMQKGKLISTREMARLIAKMPLAFEPGEKWMYGLSADIMGAIIEVASDMKYSDFLSKYIFKPLDMKDTGFFVPENKKDRFAMLYGQDAEGKPLYADDSSYLCVHYEPDVLFESGGAGLVSTIDDYSHFALMLANDGMYNGKRICGSHSVRYLSRNHLADNQMANLDWESNKGYGYGCLVRVHCSQEKSGSKAPLGEYGWDGWTGNYFYIDPVNDIVLIFFMQRRGAGTVPAIRKIREAIYESIE